MMQEHIGLFGGTFDPIHLGHLILACDALEILNLDRLIFLPARISPYKTGAPPQASAEERLAMLELAIQGESRFFVDPRELKRAGPSYAIETVRELTQEFPGASFFYLLGEDHATTLSGWKKSEELKERVTFAFFARGISAPSDFAVLGRRIDISSTEVRERYARGAAVSYFLPTSVFHYLEKKSLYRR